MFSASAVYISWSSKLHAWVTCMRRMQEIWLRLQAPEKEREVRSAAVDMYQAALTCITRMRDMLCCEELGLQAMARCISAKRAGYGYARALHLPSDGAPLPQLFYVSPVPTMTEHTQSTPAPLSLPFRM